MNEPVRVCFVIENLLPAGTELWIAKLIQNLDRNKVIPFLCLLDGMSEESKIVAPECKTVRLGVTKLRSRHGFRSARRLYQFFKTEHIDIVQTHHADPTYFSIPIAKMAKVKRIVHTKYDTGYWMKRTDIWMHRALRSMIDATIANCQACRQASIRQEWSKKDSVVVVNNGIPLDRLSRIPTVDFEKSPVCVGMLCNLRPIKDPFTLVRAARQIISEVDDVRFRIAGDGPLRAAMENLARECNVERRFTFDGVVDDVSEFLSQIDIGVLCSKSEGLSHTLLEYMAAGRAIVVTGVGGNAELITHEQNGLFFPVGDHSSLARAIVRLVRNPALAQQLATHARLSVSDHFSFDTMTRRFEDFYVNLLRDKKNLDCSEPTKPLVVC